MPDVIADIAEELDAVADIPTAPDALDAVDAPTPRDVPPDRLADAALDAVDAAVDVPTDVPMDVLPDYAPCWRGDSSFDAPALYASGPYAEVWDRLQYLSDQAIAVRTANFADSGDALEMFYQPRSSLVVTPSPVPRGTCVTDPPGTWESWEHWRVLHFGFAPDEPHRFSYEYSPNSPGSSYPHFTARARGDLDGDGLASTFELIGRAQPDGSVTIEIGRIVRPLE